MRGWSQPTCKYVTQASTLRECHAPRFRGEGRLILPVHVLRFPPRREQRRQLQLHLCYQPWLATVPFSTRSCHADEVACCRGGWLNLPSRLYRATKRQPDRTPSGGVSLTPFRREREWGATGVHRGGLRRYHAATREHRAQPPSVCYLHISTQTHMQCQMYVSALQLSLLPNVRCWFVWPVETGQK